MDESNSPIKVLIICLTRRGGLLQFNDCLAESLSPLCQVSVLTVQGAEHSRADWDQQTFSSQKLDMGQGMKGTLGKLFNPKTWIALSKMIREIDPQLVHITAAQEWNPFLGIYLKLFHRVPIVYTIHDVVHHEGAPLYFRMTEALFRKMPDYFVVLTEQGKEILVNQGKSADRILVVPHGVYDFFTQYGDQNLPPKKEILFFGRIEPYKGLDILLAAAKKVLPKHPDWTLHIAGGGDISPYAGNLKHERIIVSNRFLSNEEVADAMQQASIVALPYISASQSGVIPTAFAFRKPVIATRVGGIPDMISDGENGILIPPKNAPALERALNRLIDDEEERNRLGENGWRFAQEELGWQAIAKKHLAFYRKILKINHAGN